MRSPFFVNPPTYSAAFCMTSIEPPTFRIHFGDPERLDLGLFMVFMPWPKYAALSRRAFAGTKAGR